MAIVLVIILAEGRETDHVFLDAMLRLHEAEAVYLRC